MYARTLAVSVLFFALAAPASAQGPLSPPDGSGPFAQDYTGFTVLYLIPGVRIDTTDDQETQIICMNLTTESVDWGVQIFDSAPTPGLACETGLEDSLPGETDVFTTDVQFSNFAIAGGCPSGDSSSSVGVARVLANGKKAGLACLARIIDDSTRNVIANLPVIPVGKAPKVKIK